MFQEATYRDLVLSRITCFFDASICSHSFFKIIAADAGGKLDVHKTFRRRPERLLNLLCTFNLRPVSTGQLKYILGSKYALIEIERLICYLKISLTAINFLWCFNHFTEALKLIYSVKDTVWIFQHRLHTSINQVYYDCFKKIWWLLCLFNKKSNCNVTFSKVSSTEPVAVLLFEKYCVKSTVALAVIHWMC